MAPTVRSQRYLLTVEYIGSSFLGWQKQKTGRTVQGVLEQAFEKFVNQPVTISGSSRTDTGVHALGNTAHVEFERSSKRHPGEVLPPHDATTVKRAVNHFLGQSRPQDVALVDVQCVPSTFHSRFAARERLYCYRMTSSSEPLSIFEQDRTWHVPAPLNLQAMKEACALLEGYHDFSSFRASGCQANSPMRTLDELTVSEIPSWSLFTPLPKTVPVQSPKDQQVLRDGICQMEEKDETATRRQSLASECGKGIVPGPPIGGEESLRWNTTELDSPERRREEEGEGGNGGGRLQADDAEEGRESGGDHAAERKEQRECGEEGKASQATVGSKRPGSLDEEVDEESQLKRPNRQGLSPRRLDEHGGSENLVRGSDSRTNGADGSLPSPARWVGGPLTYVVVARARSFLYHQVRLMVGLIKAVGCGERSVADVKRILEARTPTAASPMAPACGLYLAKVAYPVDERGFLLDVGHDNHPSGAEELQDDSGNED